MIAYLKGTLVSKEPGRAVIEANGVGYCALIPVSTYLKLGEAGRPAELHIHTHLADDSITLFGFSSREEKDMFLKLIQISGIGPKLAMNILSGINPDELEEAVRSSDVARISLIPGVGKKTALRVAMELQDKLESREKLLSARSSPEREDLISALQNMGFRRKEVEKTVDAVLNADRNAGDFEKNLRDCLRRLARV